MRKLAFLSLFTLSLTALAVGFFIEPGEAAAPAEAAKATPATVVLAVEGVSCGSCEGHIRDALGKVEGSGEVAVDLIRRTVTVSYDPAKTAPDALAKAVSGAGRNNFV